MKEYKEHESLAYGADWVEDFCESDLESESDSGAWQTAATCSFYDHIMKIWSIRC